MSSPAARGPWPSRRVSYREADLAKKVTGGIFVTGTDTGVGKTFVAAALARAMCGLGIDVGVMKPVASGCVSRRGAMVSDDAEILTGAACVDDPDEDVCPLRFALPLGPSVAARREGRRLDLRKVHAALGRLRRRHEFLIVEGVGGLAVPLNGRKDVADLARETKLPLLVVAADRLGVLNHTALTLEYARTKRTEVAGVVLTTVDPSRDVSRTDNPAELRRMGVPLLAKLGFCRSIEGAARQLKPLARRLVP